ncbi:6-phosphogluconolactonase [Mucilaginibacter sp. KACC 22063]|uniref:6-phosphogluconolactonase n=1 Tax=Mucilaginibacter sp. KACC 22063 TaxID=3025666 RepID=UPI0023653607|nr:6-phosphogluconolactonase [Mucilaginibacter sp. KACC 22063]WDF54286.1 6-phosphogluconolactonase [Mucilaginibacter sp. KACC 22063]
MLKIFKDADELSVAAAQLFVQSAAEAISRHGKFTVALTGGSSPEKMHRLLTEEPYASQVDWSKVFVFWGDERWVPLDDDKSNAKMAFETLLNHVPIPKENIFVMWADGYQPKEYAAKYESFLKENLGDDPRFDLIFLGMGDDGHTASLFPGQPVIDEKDKWVDVYWLAPQDMYRITLTEPVLNDARKIVMLVFGTKKANALHEVLEGERNPHLYPSQVLAPKNGEILWFVDEAATEKLNDKSQD